MDQDQGSLLGIGLVLFLILSAFPGQVSSQGQPNASITLDPLNPSNLTVYPRAGEDTTVIFKTILHVDKPPVGSMDVTLTAYCSAWAIDLTPTSQSFVQSESIFIRATLTVPYTALAETERSVDIRASTTYAGTHLEDYQGARVRIAPRYLVQFDPNPAQSEKNPQVFKLKLKNLGNTNITYKIELPESSEYTKDGVHAQLSKEETIPLGPYESDTIDLTVSHDVWAPEGDRSIPIKISTLDRRGSTVEQDSFSVMFIVKNTTTALYYDIGMVLLFVVILLLVVTVLIRRHRNAKRVKKQKERRSKKKPDGKK